MGKKKRSCSVIGQDETGAEVDTQVYWHYHEIKPDRAR